MGPGRSLASTLPVRLFVALALLVVSPVPSRLEQPASNVVLQVREEGKRYQDTTLRPADLRDEAASVERRRMLVCSSSWLYSSSLLLQNESLERDGASQGMSREQGAWLLSKGRRSGLLLSLSFFRSEIC